MANSLTTFYFNSISLRNYLLFAAEPIVKNMINTLCYYSYIYIIYIVQNVMA